MAYKPGSNRCFFLSPDNVIPLTLYHDTPRDDFLDVLPLADPMEYFFAMLPDAIGGGCGTLIFNEDEESPDYGDPIGYLIEDDVQLEIKLKTTCLTFVNGKQREEVIDTINIPIDFWRPLPMRDGSDYPENKPWRDTCEFDCYLFPVVKNFPVRTRDTMPLFNPFHKKYADQANPLILRRHLFIPMEEVDGVDRFPDYMRNELTQWYFHNFPEDSFEWGVLSDDPFKGCEGGTTMRTFEITCTGFNVPPVPDIQPIGDPNAPIS
jgi:hypothetical protein